jgi:uncharacterized cupredoxin-like copper-binding protein
MVLLVAALLAAGCAPAASDPSIRTVTLRLHHSRFSTDHLEVRPGTTVRFVVENTDPIPHELIVGDQAVQDRHETGTEAHHGARDGEVSVAAGATAETRYTFSESGRLLFGCHLPGHWDYGMRGTIAVS